MDKLTRRSNAEMQALVISAAARRSTGLDAAAHKATARRYRRELQAALEADGYTRGQARTLADGLIAEERDRTRTGAEAG
jgi:hypothetical protein